MAVTSIQFGKVTSFTIKSTLIRINLMLKLVSMCKDYIIFCYDKLDCRSISVLLTPIPNVIMFLLFKTFTQSIDIIYICF